MPTEKRPPPSRKRPRLYRLPNRLKAMAKSDRQLPDAPELDVIEDVEWTPDNHAAVLDKYLDKLLAYYDWATGARHAERAAAFSAMNQIAAEIRRRGGESEYPLTARFASSLGDFTSVGAERTDNHLKIVTAHIDAMRAIVHGGIKGDGGAIGVELLQSLRQAIHRYSQR